MAELTPTKRQTQKLLLRLQKNQAEATDIDAKEMLHLETSGDRAYFIRHVAALANNGRPSYILVGVEDKTWIPKGIPQDSSLELVDMTKQQMNQILENRLDPRLTVSYITHEIQGVTIGVVGINGNGSPYICAIDGLRYGGPKTKGDESHIYRGAVYARSSTDSLAINRQRDLISIINGRFDQVEAFISLISIAAIVSVGVGFGIGLIKIPDPYTAAILGGIWGLIVGWLLNKRLADTLGKFSDGVISSLIKNLIGPGWGGMIGAYISYAILNGSLNGKVQILDPVSMGLIVGPILASTMTLMIVGGSLLANLMLNAISAFQRHS